MNMEILKVLGDPQWWRSLLGSQFNQGFISALVLILGLILILMVLRGIIFLLFRTRRCSHVVVSRPDGDTVVEREVIRALIERELGSYPAVSAEKVVLTRKGKQYRLTIYCSYLLGDQAGIPAFCDEFKPRLLNALEKGFGIKNIAGIRLWIASSDGDGMESKGFQEPAADEKNSYIGI